MPDGATQPQPPAQASAPQTKPLAAAVRDQIREALKAEEIDLSVLQAIVGIAHNGRALISVRDPMGRFDARQRSLGAPGPIPVGGPPFGYDEDYDMGVSAMPMSMGEWRSGAMGKRYARRLEEERQLALKESPVVAALRVEFSELLDASPFGAKELNQIQQLAEESLRVLRAALGIPEAHGPSRKGRRMQSSGGPYLAGGPWAPSSSSETFGAAMTRELAAATGKKSSGPSIADLTSALVAAREAGATDLVEGLEAKLRAQGLLPEQKKEEDGAED